MTTADLIREYLKGIIQDRTLNLNQFAKMTGLRQGSLHEMLHGKMDKDGLTKKTISPTTDTVDRLAIALGHPDALAFLQAAKEYMQKKLCKSPTCGD